MVHQCKYVVVDDDELSRLTIEAEASKFPFLRKIASCSNAMEAAEFISNFSPDIVFADIEMPGVSGFDLIRKMGDGNFVPVFITSHPEFALEGYELNAFDYLLKPINSERFEKCARRLNEFFELKKNAFAFASEKESGCIVIKQAHDKYRILLTEILFLEAMKDYTKIVSLSKRWLVLETITGLHQRLPQDQFVRIHRSYVVNREKIGGTKANSVIIGNIELPVGKMYRNSLTDIL